MVTVLETLQRQEANGFKWQNATTLQGTTQSNKALIFNKDEIDCPWIL